MGLNVKHLVWLQMRYLLGDSGRSLMTGFGHDSPDMVQNRAASCPDITGCTQVSELFLLLCRLLLLADGIHRMCLCEPNMSIVAAVLLMR